MANTIIYTTSYETVLQERLAHPTTWREVCKLYIEDTRTITTGYVSTVPTVNTVTRDTVTNINDIALTAENLTISTGRDVSIRVDFADLAQTGYNAQMELAQEAGDLLNEFVETNMLAQHASWRNIGDSGGVVTDNVTGQITVSATNIDDIIRMVRRVVRAQNGGRFMKSNGLFIVWRPADFDLLEAFAQANGFSEADLALKNGLDEGIKYLGVEHYVSNDLAANHVFGGVKKIQRLGILRSEYGKLRTQDFPAGSSGGFYAGTLFYQRVDIGHLTPTNWANLVFDINVV